MGGLMKHLKLATAPLARVYCRFHTEEERGRSLSVGLLYHRERQQQQHGESRSDSGRSTLKRPLFRQQLASAIGNNCKSAPASRRRPFHSTTHFLINSWQPTATTNTFIFQKKVDLMVDVRDMFTLALGITCQNLVKISISIQTAYIFTDWHLFSPKTVVVFSCWLEADWFNFSI